MKVSGQHGTPDVTCAYPAEASARIAIARLRAEGFPAADISVARGAPTSTPPPELPAMSRVFWTGFWWSIAGAAAGALLGLLIGLAGLGIPGTRDSIVIQVAAWSMFLHVTGALVGCYAALDTGDRFARKPDHHDPTSTLLRVRAPTPELAARAAAIMIETGGATVYGRPNTTTVSPARLHN